MNEKIMDALRMTVAHFDGQRTLTPDEEAILNAAKDALTEAGELRKEYNRLRTLHYFAKMTVDAVLNDMADADHTDGNGRSAVIDQGVHKAAEYLTTDFLCLILIIGDMVKELEKVK